MRYTVFGYSTIDHPAYSKPGTLLRICDSSTQESALRRARDLNDSPGYGPYDHPFIVKNDGQNSFVAEVAFHPAPPPITPPPAVIGGWR